MASNTYGAIKLSTAEDVGAVLKKKTGSQDGYKPKEWADTINLMGLLPVRTASGSIAHFTDGADDVPLKSLTAQILPIQSGTGDPSPSNPRPISGTSALNVTRTGANIWDEEWEVGGISSSTGQNEPQTDRIRTINYIPIVGGLSYYCKTNSKVVGLRYYDHSKNYLNYTTANDSVVAIPSNVFYVRFIVLGTTTYNNDISINYPSTDTDYHAYTGSTYTFDLGQEIMGGTADVVGGTGSITHIKKRLLHTDNWGTAQNAFYLDNFFTDMTSAFATSKQNPKCKCNIYIENDVVNYSGNVNDRDNYSFFNQLSPYQERLWIKDNRFSNLSDFKYYLENNEVYMAIPLATPTEYTFTGQPINSYLGTNNLYTDSGEVLDVDYRADIDLLIAELEN